MSMLTGVIRGGIGSLPGGGAILGGYDALKHLRGGGTPAGSLPEGQTGTAFGFQGFGFGAGFTTTDHNVRGAVKPGSNGACPKGYHLNKHPLPACKTHKAVPRMTLCVRNRYMNPMNGRAVARAARRIHRGEKLLRRIFAVEGHKHGRIHPKSNAKGGK